MAKKKSGAKEYVSDRETLRVQNSFDPSKSRTELIRELLESGAFPEDGEENA